MSSPKNSGKGSHRSCSQFVTLVTPVAAHWDDLDGACGAYLWALGRLMPGGGSAGHVLHCMEREETERQLAAKRDRAGPLRKDLYEVYQWLETQLSAGAGGPGVDGYALLAEHYSRTSPPWIALNDESLCERITSLMSEGMSLCSRTFANVTENGITAAVDQLNLFSVHLYFPGAALLEVLSHVDGGDPSEKPGSFVAGIELRFEHDFDRFWTIATLALWSRRPANDYNAPPLPKRVTSGSSSASYANEQRRNDAETIPTDLYGRFSAIARLFECLLFGTTANPPGSKDDGGPWGKPYLLVSDTMYEPPHFWFTGPRRTLPNQSRPRGDQHVHSDGAAALAKSVLDVQEQRSTVVAAGWLFQDFWTQRRFRPDTGPYGNADRPTYLISVGPGVETEGLGHEIVRHVSDLELRAATALYDFDSDREDYLTHLRIYEYVATDATVLLDALVLHLPSVRVRDRNRLYASLELVHQTLLQGLADLGQMSVELQRVSDKLGDKADELVAEFDRHLEERRHSSRCSIRSSLTETGHFAQARRKAADALQEAQRVQQSYNNLLQEITFAFDERRVRETEALDRYTWMVTLLFGSVGVVTAMDALLETARRGPEWTRWAGWGLVAAIGAVVVVGVVLATLSSRNIGRLGDKSFRRRYDRVRDILAETSTNSLSSTQRRIEASTDSTAPIEWDKFDAQLSSDLARLWDELNQRYEDPFVGHVSRTDLTGLERRVGDFICRSLLLSERTRRFWHFNVPRLACLYRLLPILVPQSVDDPPVLVSGFDIKVVLWRSGLPLVDGEVFLEWERALKSWLRSDRKPDVAPTAERLLRMIAFVGIRNGLNRDECVSAMTKDIEKWRDLATARP